MADIFMSYAKDDRGLAEGLANSLSANGHSVWWDTSLVGGDDFRAKILEQLNAARTVIVIWSARSVDSRWVQEEAEAGANDGKLVPVMTPDLPISAIPLGFRSFQTISVDDLPSLLQTVALGVNGHGRKRGACWMSRRMISRAVAGPILCCGIALGFSEFLRNESNNSAMRSVALYSAAASWMLLVLVCVFRNAEFRNAAVGDTRGQTVARFRLASMNTTLMIFAWLWLLTAMTIGTVAKVLTSPAGLDDSFYLSAILFVLLAAGQLMVRGLLNGAIIGAYTAFRWGMSVNLLVAATLFIATVEKLSAAKSDSVDMFLPVAGGCILLMMFVMLIRTIGLRSGFEALS